MNIKTKLLATLVLLAPLSAHALDPYQLSAKIDAFNSLAQTCEIHAKLEYGDWKADCIRATEMAQSLSVDFDSDPELTRQDQRRLLSGMQSLQTVIYLKGWDK